MRRTQSGVKQEEEGKKEWEEHSRVDADIMVEHCGSSVLAIQVEVRVLSHIDRAGGAAASLHADL